MTEKNTKQTGSGKKRRGGGLRALAASLPRVTGKAFGRRGLALSSLVADWPSVIGSELASVTVPRRLDKGGAGTLTLRVESGQALTLQHLEPLLIERINAYLGFNAISRLRLQQGPLGRRLPPPRRPAPPLDPAQEAALQARAKGVADAKLRAALERLGRAVQQEAVRNNGS